MSADALSDVLRAVRLTGAVYFAIDAAAPWMTELPHGREIAPRLMPGMEHVIEYHVLTAGSCWGGIVDDAPVRLEAGDEIVFPQGDAHVMSSAQPRLQALGRRRSGGVAARTLPPGTLPAPLLIRAPHSPSRRALSESPSASAARRACEARPRSS